MPVTDRTNALVSPAGRIVLEYTFNQQERPTAEAAIAIGDLHEAVEAVFDNLGGWWLTSGDEELIDALLDAGATLARHVHLYTLSIGEGAVVPEAGLVDLVLGIDCSPLELAALAVRAYPSDHVDFETADIEEASQEFVHLLDGTLVGPLIASASGVVRSEGRLVAACLISRAEGPPPGGGPWVSDIFRDPAPAFAGLGRVLLRKAVSALAVMGETSLGLAVTEGNAAEGLYRRLGFRLVYSRRKLAIPLRPRPTDCR